MEDTCIYWSVTSNHLLVTHHCLWKSIESWHFQFQKLKLFCSATLPAARVCIVNQEQKTTLLVQGLLFKSTVNQVLKEWEWWLCMQGLQLCIQRIVRASIAYSFDSCQTFNKAKMFKSEDVILRVPSRKGWRGWLPALVGYVLFDIPI